MGLLAALSACGGVTPQSFCQQKVNIRCDQIARCGCAFFACAGQYDPSYDTCEQQASGLCTPELNDNFCGTGSQWDPDAAAKCLRDLEQEPDTCNAAPPTPASCATTALCHS
jgi:hypothetical protein